jgi:hypothetical protein
VHSFNAAREFDEELVLQCHFDHFDLLYKDAKIKVKFSIPLACPKRWIGLGTQRSQGKRC